MSPREVGREPPVPAESIHVTSNNFVFLRRSRLMLIITVLKFSGRHLAGETGEVY